MSKIIIFDFDGVLADSVDVVYSMNKDAVRTVLGKNLTMKEYLACFEEHINKRLALLFSLTEDEKKDFVDYKAKLFPEYYTPERIKLFDCAQELAIEAAKIGELWIVSSSPDDLIKAVLQPYNLIDSFAKIIGQNRQSKNVVLERALQGREYDTVFFVTDTTGDIKETRKLSVRISTIAVTWGFHNFALLESEKPDLVVYKPEEILDFIKLH